MAEIRRLNHAVLYVSVLDAAVAFYRDVLGFKVVQRMGDGAAFLRAGGSVNDHDLGLFATGAPPADRRRRGQVGLYHLAWQVDTIDELAELRKRLLDAGHLVGESDHGVSKSLYGADADGIEFEIMWAVPRASWPETTGVDPLDLERELERWTGVSTAHEVTATA